MAWKGLESTDQAQELILEESKERISGMSEDGYAPAVGEHNAASSPGASLGVMYKSMLRGLYG